MNSTAYLFSGCTAVYATLTVLIGIQARQFANVVLAICCGITAIWAACGTIWTLSLVAGPDGSFDLFRILVWYSYLLYLYTKIGTAPFWQIYGFSFVALIVFAIGIFSLTSSVTSSDTLFSWPTALRLLICICELLLIENLYFNLPESARWHILLPCILLGGLACFDILCIADATLFKRPSAPLASARIIAMIIVAPLLVLAAFRGQRWSEPVRLSRTAAFHSATLILSGLVLLSLALAGEVFRRLDEVWGWVIELTLLFVGVIGVLLFVSSQSAKSLLDRVVVSHFFADRYDYRTQWLRCIGTLSGRSGTEQSGLQTRAIRAVADVVNSPSGALYVCDNAGSFVTWACSWNMPASNNFTQSHPLVKSLLSANRAVQFSETENNSLHVEPLNQLGRPWLAVPLLHMFKLTGIIILGPPRVTFRIDQEVFDLLGILGQEVGTYLAEQQATHAVVETRNLHEYGKRFAFVAHDIKNVSSQLALLLNNAEHHLGNPAFQQDMLGTVRSSVQKIDRLLGRLDNPATDAMPTPICLVSRLKLMLTSYNHARKVPVILEYGRQPAWVTIGPEAFDTAVTHLLNNAVEAAPSQPVVIHVRTEPERVIMDITDRGEGMSPDFVRDELFSPLKTNRMGGSGIGAYQARELVIAAGGDLNVITRLGVGTTIKLVFAKASVDRSISKLDPALNNLGD